MEQSTKKLIGITVIAGLGLAIGVAIYKNNISASGNGGRLSEGSEKEVDKAISRNYYGTTGYLPSLPRGIRNNNAGNLIITNDRWSGMIDPTIAVDKKFVTFSTFEHGIRAMIKDLLNDINKGKNTIEKIITEYAPKTENNTTAYINSVSKNLNIKPTSVITPNYNTLKTLSKAIVLVENGLKYPLSDTQFDIAYNLL